MQQIEVQILNAFTDNGTGGNPAGVVLDADGLTSAQKLKIAAAVGLSETAFVSKSDSADFKLDFFTPVRQIAHCGHATIATFSYLAQTGKIKNPNTSKETIDGNRAIIISDGMAFMEQKAPVYTEVTPHREAILAALSLRASDLMPHAPILSVNTGNSFVLVPVAGTTVLRGIQPAFDQLADLSETLDLIGFYVFSSATGRADRDVTTRMFAPRYGIMEEAGTGMAAGPLASYLYNQLGLKKTRFMIQQGIFMQEPSPSLIIVDLLLDGETITGLWAGGTGKAMSKKVLDV